MIKLLRYSAMFLGLVGPSLSAADETWTSKEGQFVYLSDIAGTAVWELKNSDGETRFYIPAFSGNFDTRSVHDGYWIRNDGNDCAANLTGPDDFDGAAWGRFTVVFHHASFPSDWTLLQGYCFDAPSFPIRGRSPLNTER